MALLDDVAMIGEIDLNKHSDYLTTLIPILLEYAEDYCNNMFDAKNPPGGVKIFLAESIKHKLNTQGFASRQMGTVSYSYDTDLPEKIKNNLKPYRKVRFT